MNLSTASPFIYCIETISVIDRDLKTNLHGDCVNKFWLIHPYNLSYSIKKKKNQTVYVRDT